MVVAYCTLRAALCQNCLASPKNHRERVSRCIINNHSEMARWHVTTPMEVFWLAFPPSFPRALWFKVRGAFGAGGNPFLGLCL